MSGCANVAVLAARKLFCAALLCVAMLAYLSPAWGAQAATESEKSFVGSEVCGTCHQTEHKAWSSSHHAEAMMLPDEASIKGDFNDSQFEYQGVVTRFTRDKDGFYIRVREGYAEEKLHKVAYTFGVYPLQQYLIRTDGGRYQAYDVAWDARPKKDGGQRWFKLLPDEDTSEGSPFHWTRHTQNWNSRCADCHSTNVQRGFDSKTNTFKTEFSEISVGCESCHGQGSLHAKLAQRGDFPPDSNYGFDVSLSPGTAFTFVEREDIAVPSGESRDVQINACGACHSRRQQVGAFNPAEAYHNQFVLRRAETPLYFADGQIRDEVFVLGSFLQSKMAQAGVECTHCHDPHNGNLKLQGNAVCTQCHKASAYDATAHHHHPANTEAAQCVTCHMPDTTYMEVDDRRDHSFRIPNPAASELTGSKSVCKDCHKAQTNQWAQEKINDWAGEASLDLFATLNFGIERGDPLALRQVTQFINDPQNPALKRATLLAASGRVPSRLTAETIQKAISSPDPLIRAAALDASDFIPLQHRYGIFRGMISDESASVRFSLARQLAGHEQFLSGKEREALLKLLSEYESQLKLSADAPAGQLALADYYTRTNKLDKAFAAFDKALEIEPAFAAALLNKADLQRATGDDGGAEQTLRAALDVASDSGAVQHSYGLNLIRQGRKSEALEHLRLATQQEDANSRYFYVLAVAQDGEGQTSEAIKTLELANERWPHQYDVLFALVSYLEKTGRTDESLPYLSTLSAIAPNDPAVRARINRASRQ